MFLREIGWTGFRNLETCAIELDGGFNVFEGDNGQGKTNLLEAVYWLATLRPLRATRLQELIRFGERRCAVTGRIVLDGLEHRLEARIEEGERQCLRELKACRPAEYFGALAVVLFTPDDVGLVRGPPGDRRRYLDRAVFTGRPAHLADVLAYQRALAARNELLRTSEDVALHASFEAALAGPARRLLTARATYLERLTPFFVDAFRGITGLEAPPGLSYRPSLAPGAEDALAEQWAAERERDRERGFTGKGPHADDFGLALGERSARLYASQGQQRALVLALKIAEIRLLEAFFGLTPVLLLDDVSSELDAERNARLFELLHGFRGQVLITTTEARHVQTPDAAREFRVEAGRVTRVQASPSAATVDVS
ncbi:DNA replication/repair protein RecF [Myxococcota bacterium]|nr:DNA replication/repair protein RecF [Myxococcota bacterium]